MGNALRREILGIALLLLAVFLVGAFALAAVLVAIKTPAFGLARGALYYQMLTGHAILGFVYWFAFIQAALLIAGATALRNGGRLWSTKLGWAAFVFMAAGLVIHHLAVDGVSWRILLASSLLRGWTPMTMPPLASASW